MKPVMKGKLMTKKGVESQEINGTNRTSIKKEKFLKNLSECLHITKACKQAGIGRSTYYRWYEEDKQFKDLCLEIEEKKNDDIECALYNLIVHEGNAAATIFASKTRLKDRGYGEVKEVNIISNERDAFTETLNTNARDSIMTGILKNV